MRIVTHCSPLLATGSPHTSQWFRAIDRDSNGTLDAAELQRALALGNLHFSLQAVAHMIRWALL